jgi:histidinol-phosphatase (PHP family)
MVRIAKPTIVGHLDKIKIQNYYKPYFSEDESWYIKLVEETLQTIKDSGKLLEVNTRGWYKSKTQEVYPSNWILYRANQLDIPVVINSDAHVPSEISAGFNLALETLEEVGYKHVFQMENGLWQPQAIQKFQGLKLKVQASVTRLNHR